MGPTELDISDLTQLFGNFLILHAMFIVFCLLLTVLAVEFNPHPPIKLMRKKSAKQPKSLRVTQMVKARYTLKDTKCGVNIATSNTYHTEPIRDRSVETQLMSCHRLDGVQPE